MIELKSVILDINNSVTRPDKSENCLFSFVLFARLNIMWDKITKIKNKKKSNFHS